MTMISRRMMLLGSAAIPFARIAHARTGDTPRLGSVLEASGTGTLHSGDDSVPLVPGLDLFEGDTVETGENGLALLFLDQRTRINLGLDSRIELASFLSEVGGTINVGGAMVFDRPDDLPPLDLHFVTAFGEIGVRGTRFFVGPSRGEYAVFVQRGRVEVTNAGTRRSLNAGEGCALTTGAPGEVAQWGEARITEAFASLGVSPEE